MGRQILTGVSPIALQRCTALPSNCNITAADVVKSLPSCTTLEAEMKVNRKKVTFSDKHFEISFFSMPGSSRDERVNDVVSPMWKIRINYQTFDPTYAFQPFAVTNSLAAVAPATALTALTGALIVFMC